MYNKIVEDEQRLILNYSVMETRRVILDVDVGTDDYLAILLFLHAEKLNQIKIEAIMCTMGNTSVNNVCKNVVRLLEITKRTDIPIYKGSREQLIKPRSTISIFHGADGFGDLNYDNEPNLKIINPKPAAVALRDIIIEYPGEIDLICVAALTNVALAIKLYDDFVPNLKSIWIMGGNYTAVGNITASAEYNFYIDPEAAQIVLDSIKAPIYILTWETCLHTKITFEWRDNVFGQIDNPAIKLLNKAENVIYNRIIDDFWLPCDAYLAAAYLYPSEIIEKSTYHYATVELNGQHTRGQIVLDHLKKNKPNIIIIEYIKDDNFKTILMRL